MCAARGKSQRKTRRVEAEGEGKMIDDKKSTDPGLSAAERKTLRGHEAQEAIADHEAAQKVFHENRERLREERLVREAAEVPMVAPTPELPDDTPIERVLFPTRIQNALRAADLKTVGEVREISDETLISLRDFGRASLIELRRKLGLPSTDGVRPITKKLT
jgi:DNA-directed RNA polymerase alpha subunit